MRCATQHVLFAKMEFEFALGGQRVERNDHRASLEQAIASDQELGRIGPEHDNPITFLDAQVANAIRMQIVAQNTLTSRAARI